MQLAKHMKTRLRAAGGSVAATCCGSAASPPRSAPGTVVLRPQAAGATTGALQFGQNNDSGSDATGITSTNAAVTLQVSNTANAPALALRSGGADSSRSVPALHALA